MRNMAFRTMAFWVLAASLYPLVLAAKPAKKVLEPMPDRPPSGERLRVQTDSWGSTWDWNQDPGTCPQDVLRTVRRGLYKLDAQ